MGVSEHVEVRPGAYHDSVSLMQVSRQVASAAGVEAAQVAMGTDLNLDLIRDMGFDLPASVGPNDLVVAVRAGDDAGVTAAREAVEDALAGLRSGGGSGGGSEALPPRTTGSAVRAAGATLALVSVPGPDATVEALDAIRHGVSVMVFSDNVPVEDEVLLKEEAAGADVLVMGPDCGTAVVGGVALGFANAVRPGPVGIVAASGTGAQQVMCLLDAAGVGTSHCLGVGGRDLSAQVGGRSARAALAALAEDPGTSSVVVVSKPAAPTVVSQLEAVVAGLGLPVHWATLGPGRPDLTAAVEAALSSDGHPLPRWPSWPVEQEPVTSGYLRGLFCGGTLADEAMLVAADRLGGIRSNIPLRPDLALAADGSSRQHTVIDFGDDAFTRGRAHPMIDPTLRLERIVEEGADPTCGVLLLDLVLGHAAHPDPADHLAGAIGAARERAHDRGRELPVVVSLIGVEADPQGRGRCVDRLRRAGASVYLSNAQAARRAASLLPEQQTSRGSGR